MRSPLAASVSIGMCVGGAVGAVLAGRAAERPNSRTWWGRSALISLPAACVAGGLVAWPAIQLGDADLLAATVGAVGAALVCMMIFVGFIFLADRDQGALLWSLVRRRNTVADRS